MVCVEWWLLGCLSYSFCRGVVIIMVVIDSLVT